MKKIMIFLNSLSRGGAERVSINLASYFSNNNIECVLLTTNTNKEEYDVPKNVKRLSLESEKNYFKKILKFRKIISAEKPDKLLIMDTPGCIYAMPAIFLKKVKAIVSERNDPKNFEGKRIVKYISRLFMKFANGYVFQTEDAKKFYKKYLKDKGIVIYNPVFMDSIPCRNNEKIEDKIVAVGRLTNQKNHKMLIDAFEIIKEEYPNLKLEIYGEGCLHNELQDLINNYGLINQVFLKGNKKNVLECIKDARLFVLSSKYEGMPNALIESMAIGIPSISTDCPCGGPKTLINNNVNGFLVPLGDAKLLAEKIDYCLSNYSEMYKISKEAIKIREELNIDIICRQWYEYLESV